MQLIRLLMESLQNCTMDVTSWMTTTELQLNLNKIEVIVALSNRMSIHSTLSSVIHEMPLSYFRPLLRLVYIELLQII